ncbi:MAG: tetratricopeptide repeat protein [Woeseiaceae bacterium]|nr:tetratricopeptide repeat protein [Woeseiaceae bacterium]
MNRFIRELRRREVFRTAGLYVGICWIVIEAASIVLPTFDAPDWALRAMIIAAVVGFPVTLVLAWIYDFTDHGIEVQADPTDTIIAPLGSRKMDFVVIGILVVALAFSVYLNLTSEGTPVEEPDPVSILIADFGNNTGNPLFDGLLEQALVIGVEGAPHITSYERNAALSLATSLQGGVEALDVAAARLVAVREGVDLVLAGAISAAGAGFEIELSALDPETGEPAFDVSSDARDSGAVLTAVGLLSEEIREELGDTTLDGEDATTEAFTAASLEAAQAYTTALDIAFAGRHEEAAALFEKATQLDPNFGRAYSSWAASEFKLGRTEKATELWNTALSMMHSMTERERLRTLGVYYIGITGNYENAVRAFSELVEKYPADAAGHNNLAVAAFMTRDFERASEEGRLLLEIYPESELYRANYALFSMYSGDFELSAVVARELITENPDYAAGYLPVAINSIAQGDLETARETYSSMTNATSSFVPGVVGTLGLADVAIYAGEHEDAIEILVPAIEQAVAAGSQAIAAAKQVALAEAHAAAGDFESATLAAQQALDMSYLDSVKVAVARIFLAAGDTVTADGLATELIGKVQPQSRAYGLMIQAMLARGEGYHARSTDLLRNALDLADLWLVRFELGRTYVEAGLYAEAIGEFMACEERRGEAAAIFLNDMPTYRFMAQLTDWKTRAQEGLGMSTPAGG